MRDHQVLTKLYKYCAFGVNALRTLEQSIVYYADPNSFNDPLDCSPVISVDSNCARVEELCSRMIQNSTGSEKAESKLDELRYYSTQYGDYRREPEVERYYINSLGDEIRRQLHSAMKNKGVLSLAQNWDCPLMWSHYADQHRGLCIEYDLSELSGHQPKPIIYGGDRGIRTSDLDAWVFASDEKAYERIETAFLYTKAEQWRYECEWRLLNERQGESPAQFPISAIYFGMRCDGSVEASIVKLMVDAEFDIKFFNVRANHDTFSLNRYSVNVDELCALSPRMPAFLAFSDLPPLPSNNDS